MASRGVAAALDLYNFVFRHFRPWLRDFFNLSRFGTGVNPIQGMLTVSWAILCENRPQMGRVGNFRSSRFIVLT